MQIGQLADKLNIPVRDIGYALERGHADRWIERTLGSGFHRDLLPSEAFALGILMMLKWSGLRLPEAERVVHLIEEGFRTITQGFGWEHQFRPFAGELQTDFRWEAEVGDREGFRLGTDSDPSLGGEMCFSDWTTFSGRRRHELPGFLPCVTLRFDLARLCDLVGP